MDVKERYRLVTRNVEEVLTEKELKDLLKKENPSIYWGTAPTGRPHVGYLFPFLKIADLLKAGFSVKILLADIHAAMDNVPWDVLDARYKYYEKLIPLAISSMGASVKDLEFVKGSSFQLKKDYVLDLMKLSSFASVRDAGKAASEVVKQSESPRVSGLLYPLMQALDEQYLGVDAQLGGMDQRKIFVLARGKLPRLGYKSRVEIMNPILPGLVGKKMSASIEGSKIDFLDSSSEVKKKVNSAEMIAGNTKNGLMVFLKNVVMTLKTDKGEKFVIKRPEKFGGNLEYSSYSEIEKDFKAKKLHPLDLKNAVAEEINNYLDPIRKHSKELEKLAKKAYS